MISSLTDLPTKWRRRSSRPGESGNCRGYPCSGEEGAVTLEAGAKSMLAGPSIVPFMYVLRHNPRSLMF